MHSYMCMYVVCIAICVCVCTPGEHVCRLGLLCDPCFDKIDNNIDYIVKVMDSKTVYIGCWIASSSLLYFAFEQNYINM